MPVTSANHVVQDLAFPPLSRPVRVTGRADRVTAFVTGLGRTLTGWLIDHRPGGDPFCSVTAGPDGYTIHSDYLDAPLCDLDTAAAVCCTIADLVEAYLDAHPGMRALHCGAARISGRIVLFSGIGHAGKSTLMARLGMEPGISLYCDDFLPIRPDGTALSMGVPPRVRLPLPASAGPAFEAFVNGQGGLRDDSYAYVPGPAVLPYGSTGQPDALLLLRRQPGAAARLHALPAQAAASAMLAQDMSLQADGMAHIDRVTDMAGRMWCATLVYDDLTEVVGLLTQTFGQADLQTVPLAPAIAPEPPAAKRSAIDAHARWGRNAEVGLRSRLGAAFLWAPSTGRYFSLNHIALVCWSLIEEPKTMAEIVHDLTTLFPDATADQVRKDVSGWLGEMDDNGLIIQA